MSYDGLGLEDRPPPPRVRFETIGEAWNLFQKQMGAWLGAGAIAMVVLFGFMGICSALWLIPFLTAAGKEPNVGAILGSAFLGGFLLIVGSIVLGGLFSAGFYRMAHKQLHGGTLSVGDLFDIKDIFWPMLGMSLLVGLVCGAVSSFVLPVYILGGLWMLAGPLIVEKRLGVIESMSASWKALQHELIMAACYYLVISLIASAGVLVLGIGVIFTMPLMYLGLALVYRDFFPDSVSER